MTGSQNSTKSFADKIICGDTLATLKKFPTETVDCVVTSPPYWALRDYNVAGQIGLELSIEEYLEKILAVFDEIKRVLKPTGTCWINFGDTYSNKTKGGQRNKPQNNMYNSLTRRAAIPKLKVELAATAAPQPKSLCLIPSRFAIRMIERGWILRNEIIWHKPNVMPQSVKDRFTVDFEKVFFFVKNRKYYFRRQYEPLKNPVRLERRLIDPLKAHKRARNYWFSARPEISEKRRLQMIASGRNKRCVWRIGTTNFSGNHFAVYPERLVETPILAGSPKGGIVLDPFMGSGTTAVVARRLDRKYIGIELNPEYARLARNRIKSSNKSSNKS